VYIHTHYVSYLFCTVIFFPPLWSTGHSSWLQIHRSLFDSRRYQIFWVVGLERDLPNLVSTIEQLLERKSSGFGLENRRYGRRDSSHWPRDSVYPQKLALTSLASGGRSVGIVRSRLRPRSFFTLPWPLDCINSPKKDGVLFEDQKQADFCNGDEENSDFVTREFSFLRVE
jgi:hypothetical protein